MRFPAVLGLNELLGLRLGLGVSDLDVVASWLAILLILLEALVSILDVGRGILAKVVPNDAVNRRLRSIRASVGELLLWEGDLHSAALQRTHSEGDPEIVRLSVNVVLRCRHVSSDN